ncbi:Secreted metalloproteinase [Geosmithia morbida]|uniref:Secreted metalloproteinase n=1 Tax=Geosmithia morbida TaxID=1094350 RepID=A0A9P5D0P4_9HYPO|nr:Secreted metalloproteinase [Geosmithia morbida]KAF4122958.1 Secreted metalloproteinase [Geosmithia morbida]
MSVKSALLFASAALAHTLHSRETTFACGTPDPTDEHIAIAHNFSIKEAAAAKAGLVARQDIFVNVYLHSVSASQGGLLTGDALQRQFDVLASTYAAYGITMSLAGTDGTVNSGWASDGDEYGMKSALRKGSYSDLNLYFLDSLSGGSLGYCYFPQYAPQGSDAFVLDGCAIQASTIPGGSASGFNEGLTAVHETGHWLGLFHTFQGGCDGAGDEVADTPAQASASSGCPTGRDSCPNSPGEDPIHNYMDYSQDSCYNSFTDGQRARMDSSWSQFRG